MIYAGCVVRCMKNTASYSRDVRRKQQNKEDMQGDLKRKTT